MMTPWGDSETLRERMLPPGRGVPHDAARKNQRERLMAAMVATSAEKGYEATRVADLVELSGVSRKAFYKLFANKQDCFGATQQEILTAAMAVTASRLRRQGSWEERARRAMHSFIELLVSQPAAARLCMVESFAAGPAAAARMEEALKGFETLTRQAFEEMPERRGMPEEMVGAMVGGFRKIIHTRLHRGSEGELTEQIDDLLALGLSYRPPPAPLQPPRRAADPAPSDNHRSTDQAERLIRATMSVVASQGYPAAKIADIVAVAGVSLSTFYSHFDGKEEAFDAALYGGRARMLGMALPAYRRARSWPEGIRAVTEATITYLEGEPDFARLIAVDVYAAGPEALERRDLAIDAAQRSIDDGAVKYAPGMPPIAREGVISSLYAMLCERVRSKGVAGLREIAPLATYMAVSPFIGPEAACTVANGGTMGAREG